MAKIKKKDTFKAIVGIGNIPKEERATTGIRPGEPTTAPAPTPSPTPEPTPTPAPTPQDPVQEPTLEETPQPQPSTDPNAATIKQISYLDGLGVSYNQNISKSEATALLTQAIAEAENEGEGTTTPTDPSTPTPTNTDPYSWQTANNPATEAQKSYLTGLGVTFNPAITKAQASVLLKSAIQAKKQEQGVTQEETDFTAGSVTTKELSDDEVKDTLKNHFNISSRNIREMDKLLDNVDYQEALNFIEGDSREDRLKAYLDYIYNGVGGPDDLTEQIVTQPNNIADTDVKNVSGDITNPSFVEHIAVLGLTPAAIIGNAILAGYEIILNGIPGANVEGVKFGRADAEEMAQTWFGKALGLATSAALVANIWSAGSAIAALGTIKKGGLIASVATIFAANTFVLEPQELATWAAVDNIASATSFQVNQISYGVSQGIISLEEANDLMNLADRNINKAEDYVNTTTMYNPKLWPSRAILLQAIQTARDSVAIQRTKINTIVL